MFGNQLKRPAKMRESIMIAVMVMLSSYSLYANVYVPKKQKNEDIQTQIKEASEKRETTKKLNITLQQKYAQQKNEMQIQEQQERLSGRNNPRLQMIERSRDPAYKTINDFLNALTTASITHGAAIDAIKHDPTVMTVNGYGETKFFLQASGRFEVLVDLIESIEQLPALLTIDRVNLQAKSGDQTSVSLDLMGTFYQLGSDNA